MGYGVCGERGLRDWGARGEEGVSDVGRSLGFFSHEVGIVAGEEVVGERERLGRLRVVSGWSSGGIWSCRVLFAWRPRVCSEMRRVRALKMSCRSSWSLLVRDRRQFRPAWASGLGMITSDR